MLPQTIAEWEAWVPAKSVLPRLGPMKTITLERVTGDRTTKPPRGTIFTYTYKSLDQDQALRRATLALEREHPGADRLDWKLIA